MAIRSDELQRSLQHLNGMLTTHEAAKQLDLSYWHFMHLVEEGRIPGVRIVDRWLFSPDDIDDYRRSKYGKLEDMARTALNHPAVDLTERQTSICLCLINNERPSSIARKLKKSRQAIHSQISLIREKVSRSQAEPEPAHAVADLENGNPTESATPSSHHLHPSTPPLSKTKTPALE